MIEEFQILPDGKIERRWFKDAQVDVVVWILPEDVFQFQITYLAKAGRTGLLEQRVVKYSKIGGLLHYSVPPEESPFPTPKILKKSDQLIPRDWLKDYLTENKGKIPDGILHFILVALSA